MSGCLAWTRWAREAGCQGRGRATVLSDPKRAESRLTCLICQSHDECQSDVESCDIAVEVTDLSANSCAPNRDGLVGHHDRVRRPFRAVGSTATVKS